MGLIGTLKFITRHPFNRDRKISALKRFFAWQFGCRFVPGPVVVRFVNDAVLLVGPGMTGATGNIYTGLHEFEDMAFVLHFLRPEDLFVDVGANIGSYTLLASAAVGARSISFEPVPDTFRLLLRNISLNDVKDKVIAHNSGVGHEAGVLHFTSGLDTVNHVANADELHSIPTVEVPIVTLDTILDSQQPALIKIDVEGFETNVINGADTTLSQPSLTAIVMELNGSGKRYGFDDNVIHRRMVDHGFTPSSYNPFTRTLVTLDEVNSLSGNTLYIRNREFVQQRLSSAPRFRILDRSL